MPQKLEELEIREVSLVDRPANASVDPATGVKVPRARVALFKRDNEEEQFYGNTNGSIEKQRSTDPNKGDNVVTLEQIEKRVTEQDVILKTLTDENTILKSERDLVLKMSKEQRQAYASMTADTQQAFLKADAASQVAMCDTAMKSIKEKAQEDCMDEATKAEFAKAGPARRAQILADVAKDAKDKADAAAKADKAKAFKAKPTDDGDMEDAVDGGSDEEEEDLKLHKREEELIHKQERADLILVRKNIADTTDRLNKAEAQLVELRKAERLSIFTKRAEAELPNTAGDPVQKGTHLMTLADSLPGGESSEVFKTYLENLKVADKALTIHFGEVGKAGGEIPAEKALNAAAAEISKRDKIDASHAMAKAMSENPELYIAYETQHRAAVRAQ